MKNFYLKVDFGIFWPIYILYIKHGLIGSVPKTKIFFLAETIVDFIIYIESCCTMRKKSILLTK